MNKNPRPRTAAGLRDVLFDEIEQLRGENPNPQRSLAVSKIAGQIISVARAEIDMQAKLSKDGELCDDYQMGELRLGERKGVQSVGDRTTEG